MATRAAQEVYMAIWHRRSHFCDRRKPPGTQIRELLTADEATRCTAPRRPIGKRRSSTQGGFFEVRQARQLIRRRSSKLRRSVDFSIANVALASTLQNGCSGNKGHTIPASPKSKE